MHLGKIIGTVVATAKQEGLEGVKLHVIQPLDHNRVPKGDPVIAANVLSAGEGEIVTYVLGREGSLNLPVTFVAVDAGVVGVIDSINAEGKYWTP